MLQTWRDSWFAEGSRLYIVPPEFVSTVLPQVGCFRVTRHSPAEVSRCPPDRFASLRFPHTGGQLGVTALSCALARRPYARQCTLGPVKSHPPSISFDHGKHCGSNGRCGVRTGA